MNATIGRYVSQGTGDLRRRKDVYKRQAHEDDTTSDTAADVPPPKCPKFVLTHDADGTYRLTLYAKNGKAIAASPGDATHGAALDSLDAIRAVAREAHTTGA